MTLGFTLRYILDRRAPTAADVGTDLFPVISVAAIVTIVAGVVGANVDTIATAGLLVIVTIVAHNAIGLGAGYGDGRLTGMADDRVRAMTFEVGLQNSGLAVALAISLFEPAAALIPALFSVWHNVTGPGLASLFSPQRTAEEQRAAATVMSN